MPKVTCPKCEDVMEQKSVFRDSKTQTLHILWLCGCGIGQITDKNQVRQKSVSKKRATTIVKKAREEADKLLEQANKEVEKITAQAQVMQELKQENEKARHLLDKSRDYIKRYRLYNPDNQLAKETLQGIRTLLAEKRELQCR